MDIEHGHIPGRLNTSMWMFYCFSTIKSFLLNHQQRRKYKESGVIHSTSAGSPYWKDETELWNQKQAGPVNYQSTLLFLYCGMEEVHDLYSV